VPETTEPAPFVEDAAKAAKGRALYGELNCGACHEAKTPAPPLPSLPAVQATRGCLANTLAARVPDYHLDAKQRDALRAALLALNRADLAAPSAAQHLAQTMTSLHCTACHTRDGIGGVAPERDAFFTSSGEDLGDEGRLPPGLDGVGDRLRPAWLSNVLATGASVRPYFNTRMPQFGSKNVGHLTDLFVALDRRAQAIPPVPDGPARRRTQARGHRRPVLHRVSPLQPPAGARVAGDRPCVHNRPAE
jgi:mono/diheme cytochrome c family protein